MAWFFPSPQGFSRRSVFPACALAALLGLVGALAPAQQPRKVDVLRIGTSGRLAVDESGDKQEGALETLRGFIKSETGFDNEILPQRNYLELAEKLASGQLNLGVFQGFEFAWAQEGHSDFRPLAIAVNVYPYRYAHVLVRQDSKVADFAGLQGQALALPQIGQEHLRLFVERHSQAAGKPLEAFFSRVTNPTNIEDAVDDVVDRQVQATVVDRVGLEAYRRRKPGRFNQLKEVARSEPFPPPLVAYVEGHLDKATLQRFQDGLLNARKKEKGQRLLNLFKLTGFAAVPAHFDQVLAETRKTYPPSGNGAK
jgi:ABC-type phosphate/phosphonate transport system substrate-binding protein